MLLYDINLQRGINMNEINVYNFIASAGQTFKVFYGDLGEINSKIMPERITMGNVYPNPATDILQVYTKQNDNYNLEVYNLEGALILNTSFNQETTIDLSGFNQGVYLIKFSSALKSETYHFVKI